MASEKELKEREAAIEEREKELAAREEKLAAREEKLGEKAGGKKQDPCPAKYLKGLSFNGVKHEKVKDPKTKKETMKHTPFTRPVEPADVLSWRDAGDVAIIVVGDGKKYEVKK